MMLKIENLSFSYRKRTPQVLNGINLELGAGEVGILLGKNGSGKTTLFKNILGILSPQTGSVYFDGTDISKLSRRDRARLISYVPQEISFGALTVFDSVLMGRVSNFGVKAGAEDYIATEKVIFDMGLENLALRNVEQLSGGERQKTAIARALVQDPKLLIFDEPTGNLDIANELLIIEEAKKLAKEKNIAVLCSLHDLNLALSFGDKFFFLRDGAVLHHGGEEIFTETVINQTFDVDVRIISAENQKIIIGGKHK